MAAEGAACHHLGSAHVPLGDHVHFIAPDSISEAVAAADDYEDSRYLAGGTAVVLMLREGLISPEALVSLECPKDRPVLRRHGVDGKELLLGAGLSLAEVAASPIVRAHAPSLAHACGLVGNMRVRNAATLGGNIAEADYASDPPAVLTNLGSRFVVHGPQGQRTVDASEMFVSYLTTSLGRNEMVTQVRIPLPEKGQRASYVKFSSRSAADRPSVGVAVRLTTQGSTVRVLDVVVGAVSGSPQRLPSVTAAMAGRELSEADIDDVADAYGSQIEVIDDLRGSAPYRREIVRVLVRRAIRSLRSSGEVSDA